MIKPKQSVQKMKGYLNANHGRAVTNRHRLMKLDSNESTITPSPRVVAALTSFIQSGPLNWYPDVDSRELIDRLARYTNLPADYIQTFNGSDNALEAICKTFIEPKSEVVLCMPTYDHFRLYAESSDATLVPVFGKNPFVPKMEALLAAVTSQTRIIYIVSPNNPTGMSYPESDIRQILTKVPDVLVIVDEAYYEFSGVTMAPLVQEFDNLLVCRSFSKAFGLAGLRCGYVITSPKNLEGLNKVRVGKNINSLAQIAACAALDDIEYVEHYVAEVLSARTWLTQKIAGLGLEVIETPANYILVKVSDPKTVLAYLESNNVMIRDRSHVPQMEGYVRITIGHQLLMERFWKTFQTIPTSALFNKEGVAENQKTS